MDNTNLTIFNHERKFAGFFTRLFAFILDYLILIIPLHILTEEKVLTFFSKIISDQLATMIPNTFNPVILNIFAMMITAIASCLIFLLISSLYNPVFESSKLMATPGKMFFKIKVCDLNGERISFLKALNRQFHRFDMFLPLLFGILISFVFAFFEMPTVSVLVIPLCLVISGAMAIIHYPMIIVHSKKQSLHDYFAKTYVIQNPQNLIVYWIKIFCVIGLFFLAREFKSNHQEKIEFSYTPSIEKNLNDASDLEVISRVEEFNPKNNVKQNTLGNFGEQILPPKQEITYEIKTDKFTKVGFKSLLTEEEKSQIKSTGIRFREINTNSIITADSQVGFFAQPVDGKITFSLTNQEDFPFKVSVYHYESQ